MSFWKKLTLTGQVALISGGVLLISFFLTWYSESITCSGPQCTDTIKAYLATNSHLASGWTMATGGVTLNVIGASGEQSYSFPLLWLVVLAGAALIIVPILGALGRLAAQPTRLMILIASGAALLVEVGYMLTAFASFSPLKGDIAQGDTSSSTTSHMATLPGFGFWLGLLVTLAVVVVSLYVSFIRKAAASGSPLPYRDVMQAAAAQPDQLPTQDPDARLAQPSASYQPTDREPDQAPDQQPLPGGD
jgi:hypothetical protein